MDSKIKQIQYAKLVVFYSAIAVIDFLLNTDEYQQEMDNATAWLETCVK